MRSTFKVLFYVNGRVNIPDSNVWMSEMELMELFGVIAPTLRAAIKAILEWEELSSAMRLVTFLIIINYMNEYKCSQNMRLL